MNAKKIALAKKIARIGQLREGIKAYEKEIEDLIVSLGPLPEGKDVYGDWILDVKPNKRFDARTAKENLTKKEYQSILKPKPDSALAKALLEDRYELCQKVHGQTVRVYRPKDD